MTRILICEDDNAISDLLLRLLTREGYRCEQVYSGTEALRLLSSERYDLILLDLMLPGKSGEEVLSSRADETPVIVLSAKSEMRNRLEVLRLGADDFMEKPFHNEELLLRIRALLRRTRRSESSRQKLELAGLSLDREAMTVAVAGAHPAQCWSTGPGRWASQIPRRRRMRRSASSSWQPSVHSPH